MSKIGEIALAKDIPELTPNVEELLMVIVERDNRARYPGFWSFYRHYMGRPLINVFLRVYFDVFRQCSRFNFRQSKQSSFYIFGVFVDSRVW